MTAIAQAIAGLTGWRRHGCAFVLGLIAAGAMPPAGLWLFLFVAFPPLVWLIDGATRARTAFAAGWWFGFGFLLAGLHWLAYPMLIEPERFAWMIPFAVGALPAGLAIFAGLATLVTWLAVAPGWRRVVIFGVAWTAGEWLRGTVLSGFPWNLVGYAWSENLAVMQTAAMVGVYGLTLVTVWIAAMPATLGMGSDWRHARWLPAAVAFLLFAAMWIGGAWRLDSHPTALLNDVRLRIVQANIAQRLKWEPGQREANLLRYVVMSRKPGEAPALIIWPETASTFEIATGNAAARVIAEAAPPGGFVVTGAPRGNGLPGAAYRAFNSLQAVAADGVVAATYDKHHLVPFGEYLPLRPLLRQLGMEKLTQGGMDFSAGDGPQTLALPGAPPFSPLICYEAIFPAGVVDVDQRPSWLLAVTNDAWFGPGAGPWQHFQMARMRSVEQGLPLVRAANTGVSGVVDPLGRVLSFLEVNTEGVLDAVLPAALEDLPPYARFGDLIVFSLGLAGILAAWLSGWRRVAAG